MDFNTSKVVTTSNVYNISKTYSTRNKKEMGLIRSSFTLVTVCFLFFIAEFPQAILLFLSLLDENFYNEVYRLLGDLMDILVLINYSICFSLYCSMSQEFRHNFRTCLYKD